MTLCVEKYVVDHKLLRFVLEFEEGGVRTVSMLDSVLFSSLNSALQAGQLRNQVYANNIANANTPGYKRQTVAFESLLQASLGNGSTGSTLPMAANSPLDVAGVQGAYAGVVSPQVLTDTSSAVSSNGNNVNMDAEMSDLAQNQIDYAALVQEYNNQFTMLRTAIVGS